MNSRAKIGIFLPVFLVCLNVVSSAITVDIEASEAFNQVRSGSKKYVVFQLGSDLKSLVLDKVSNGDFSSLLADLVKAKKASEPRYAIYSANVRATSDTKLVFFTWTPLSASVTLKKVYKEETDDVIEALGADIWVQVHTGSENDLNLDNVVESGLAGYNIIESSEYVYDLQDNVGSKETVTVDSSAVSAFSKVVSGSSSYVIFDISDDFSSVSLEKVGARGADFASLASDLEGAVGAKFALFMANVQVGNQQAKKLFLIDWIPAHVSDSDRVKIRSLVPHLKKALNAEIFFELPTSSVDDLNQKKILNLALGGKVETPSGHVQFTLNPGAVGAASDLAKGAIRYALFKFSKDFTSIVVDKVAPLKADFNAFIDDLIQAQNDKEPRYAAYLAPIKYKGKLILKLILFRWIPFNAPEKLRNVYDTNGNSFKVGSKIPFLLDVSASSVGDLNLDAILKVALGKDYEGQGALGGDVLGEADANIPDVKFDMTSANAIKQLAKGLKRYVVLNLSPTGQVTLDKVADKSASFENLKADFVNAQRKGEAKYAIFLTPIPVRGQTELKLIHITWVPLNVPKKLRLLYIKSVPKFKKSLGTDFWSEFTAVTLHDLELTGLVKTGMKNNLLKLSLGGQSLNLGSDLLNPIGVLGNLVGTAGGVVGGLAGSVLSLGQGLLGGVLGLGSNLINSLLGGVLGGKGGLLGGILGGGEQGGLIGGLLGGGKQGGGLLGGVVGGEEGGLLGGFLGGKGGGLLGGLLGGQDGGPLGSVVGGVSGAVEGVVKTGSSLLNQELSGITGDTSGGFLGGVLEGSGSRKPAGFLLG